MRKLPALALAVGVALAGPGLAAQATPSRPSPAGMDGVRLEEGKHVRGIDGQLPLSDNARIRSWQKLQYGMFIHWGLYSELGGVWQGERVTRGYSEQIQMWATIPDDKYAAVAERFRAEKFDPEAICSLAKDAGMRYIVITSKHHDGFAMFDTDTTNYDIVDRTPYGRDPLKRLAEECREQGLKFGVYFSLVDWHAGHEFDHSNENPIPASMEPLIKGQLRELLTNYGPIAEVWFDMSAPTVEQSKKFAQLVHKLQPQAVVNGRVWNNQGDFRVMGDNQVPKVALDGAWQTPASIYHETWGYRSWQQRTDLPGKVEDLVEGLVSVQARGGNYLLNIGPRGDGSVVKFEARVLRRIGDWLDRHAGAVLGAEATRFGGMPWGEVTVNGNDLFLHVMDRPADGELVLPRLATKPLKVIADGRNQELEWRHEGDKLIVTLPDQPTDPVLPVIRVELAGPLRIMPDTIVTPGTSGKLTWGPDAWQLGRSYADRGTYSSRHRTTVRRTAYVNVGHGGRYELRLEGTAEPGARYDVTVGRHARVVSADEMTGGTVGTFSLPAGRTVPVTITRHQPDYFARDLGLEVTRAALTPRR